MVYSIGEERKRMREVVDEVGSLCREYRLGGLLGSETSHV